MHSFIYTDEQKKRISKICDKLLRRKKIVTAAKISTCISANIASKEDDKFKITHWLDSNHGNLVQLNFVSHMHYLTKFYCSVSFARQYIM